MASRQPVFDFSGLVKSIQEADARLAAHAIRAVNIGLTLRNWAIGFYIAEFELRGADRSAYGERLLTELFRRLLPALPLSRKVRTASAPFALSPEKLFGSLSYSHFELEFGYGE